MARVDLEMWPIDRLVVERVATLAELETTWSIDDVVRVGHALDALQAARG